MWFDQWHPAGYLLDNFGFQAAYDSGISVGSKLSTIIRDCAWFWSYAPFDSIVEIQSRLPEVDIGIEDLPIWKWFLFLCRNLGAFEKQKTCCGLVKTCLVLPFYFVTFLHPLVGLSRCNCL